MNNSISPKDIKPTPGFILIEPEEQKTQTSSGIYLPDNAKGDKPVQGKVLSVGGDYVSENGVKKSSPVKAGDLVLYKKWAGNEVKLEGKEYLFAKFDEVLAVISK